MELKQPTPPEPVEKPQEEGLGLFDYIDMIGRTKQIPEFNEHFRKTYVPYLVNMYFSLYQDTAAIANELQIRCDQLAPHLHFLFYHRTIPKRKREWVRWYKPDKVSKKLKLVMDAYNYNEIHARIAMDLISEDGLKQLNNMQFKGGKDAK